jgi:hypothetical protein
MSEAILDKNKFREWLESKPNGELIGIQHSCFECPIASYLNERLPSESIWVVNHIEYSTGSGTETHNLPYWARSFIDRIDHVPGPYYYNPVTREQCLDKLW